MCFRYALCLMVIGHKDPPLEIIPAGGNRFSLTSAKALIKDKRFRPTTPNSNGVRKAHNGRPIKIEPHLSANRVGHAQTCTGCRKSQS